MAMRSDGESACKETRNAVCVQVHDAGGAVVAESSARPCGPWGAATAIAKAPPLLASVNKKGMHLEPRFCTKISVCIRTAVEVEDAPVEEEGDEAGGIGRPHT